MFFAVFIYIGAIEKERHHQHNRSIALGQISAVKERLEKTINTTYALTHWMIAYVSLNPDLSYLDFERLAKELLAHDRNIRHVALAKDNVITHIYPLAGNEKALGLKYLEHPEQRDAVLKAIETKDTVVAGPVRLVQGGTGFVSRTPIYLAPHDGSAGNGRYWGLTSVVIDAETLFKEAGLLNNAEFEFAIREKDGTGASGDVFFGDKSIFQSDPVVTDVVLPQGSWQLAAMPKAGWTASVARFWLRAVRLSISLLIGSLVFLFLRSQQNIIKKEERYRNIFHNATVSIWEEDISEVKKAINGLKAQGVTDFRKYLDENPEFARRAVQRVRVIDVNDSTLKLYKAKSTEELLGSLDKVFTQESYEVFKEMLVAIAEGKTHMETETINRNLLGEPFNMHIAISIPSETSEFRNLLAIISDITERKRLEGALRDYNQYLDNRVKERTAELEKAMVRVEAANRAKSEFIANMSHELRTPLNAVIGFSEMMHGGVGGPLTEKQKEFLGDILGGGRHLLSLINDILDLSKIEVGETGLELKEFSLKGMLEKSIGMFRQKASRHNIGMLLDVEEGIGAVTADERKVKQVVINLLGNACKFMPEGGSVYVRARKVKSQDTDYVEVSVEDTGVGIAKEEQKRLFNPFEQLDNVYTKRFEGMGLGLYLSKTFVEMHGGRIWLDESEVGKGSRFAFTIPFAEEVNHGQKGA